MAYALPLEEIVVDTRETLRYYASSPRETLATGDYSLVGYTNRITIERKSVADAFKSTSPLKNKKTGRSERDRFLREFGRMALMDWAAVVIEGTRSEVIDWHPPAYIKGRRYTGASVVGTLDNWSVWYGVPVHFEDGRAACKRLVPRQLKLARGYVDCGPGHKHMRSICPNCGGGGWLAHRVGCHETRLVSYADR